MRSALRPKLVPILLPVFITFFVGCSPTQETPALTPSATFLPYSQTEPTSTPEILIPTYSVVPSPGPTATPFVHIVQKDDTLLGIAIRYGVTLEEILVANPDINPRILSIDQGIIIPSLEGDVPGGLIPTATPIPLKFADVRCYPSSTGGSWCITSVTNNDEDWLEGISVIISTFGPEGGQIDARSAYAPLNVLPPGYVMPLGVKFDHAVDLAAATTNTSFLGRAVEERYVDLSVDWIVDLEKSNDKSVTAKVSILVSNEEQFGINGATLLLTAFDADGYVVGYRVVDVDEAIEVGGSFDMLIEVFSLGPPIDHVDVLAEAFPAVPEE